MKCTTACCSSTGSWRHIACGCVRCRCARSLIAACVHCRGCAPPHRDHCILKSHHSISCCNPHHIPLRSHQGLKSLWYAHRIKTHAHIDIGEHGQRRAALASGIKCGTSHARWIGKMCLLCVLVLVLSPIATHCYFISSAPRRYCCTSRPTAAAIAAAGGRSLRLRARHGANTGCSRERCHFSCCSACGSSHG